MSTGINDKRHEGMQGVDVSTRAALAQLAPDCRQNVTGTSVFASSAGTINAEVEVPMPDEAVGYVILSEVDEVRYALNETPEAVGDITATPAATGKGATAFPGNPVAHVTGSAPSGSGRKVHVLPSTSTYVYVGFF